ncbi:MAG TPA: metallophosphoesterase [Vicinamibacteria bacterium]
MNTRAPVLVLAAACGACAGSRGPQDPATVRPVETVPVREVSLPLREGSLRFAVIGDSGTGDSNQRAVARALVEARARFPYTFVIMLGDNLYGPDRPGEYNRAFQEPYQPLLDAGVKFYAALGNHDSPNQRFYRHFNMNGERYYSFKPQDGVRFFALDSNYMSPEQLAWFGKELEASGSDWKIAFFHHPLYSSGRRHGPHEELRAVLEPLFVKHGLNVVFSGHEHFYERIKPQKGVYYFTSGGAAKLRRNDIARSTITASGFDTDYHYMLVEIAGEELFFQAVSRLQKVVDSGIITRPKRVEEKAAA